MKKIAERLEEVIANYAEKLNSLAETEYAAKPKPSKWSKKEILGHLIDSAQNNIMRFVAGQYEEAPVIVYDQDKWVAICNYQYYATADLIQLWILLNKQICAILSNTSQESAIRVCITNNNNSHTIDWLAEDYIKHLLHHLHQICNLDPLPYP